VSKLHFSPNLGRLAKCTSDKCPYEHFDPEQMKRMAPSVLRGSIKLLKNSYEGISFSPEALAPAMNQLRSAMSPRLFEQIVRKKAERDGVDKYHLTVVTPPELRKLKATNRLRETAQPFTVEILGVGTASDQSSQAWFAVASSRELDQHRYSMGLPKHDFHITLGFLEKDVHGVKKDETTLL